jgi:hypothetical protein
MVHRCHGGDDLRLRRDRGDWWQAPATFGPAVRAVRCGGAAFALFGTSLISGSLPDLVGLHSYGPRLTLATVNLFILIPIVLCW